MLELLEFFAGVVVGLVVFYLLATWFLRRLISQALAEDAAQSTASSVIRARVEQHDGMFYFYNNKSGEFLVQGSNLQELLEHLELRRPGTTVQVVDGDKETIAHLKSLAK
jgi:hypothetical protein